jgi:tripartite-type tricarboxylate transporter receptor subunit TctC
MARQLAAAVVAMMAVAGMSGARAEDYPARPVTVIVPFAAGGPADITGRIVADIFSRHLGQKFVVENVGGAGGTTGALRAARATADGYTILSGHLGTNALAPAFYPNGLRSAEGLRADWTDGRISGIAGRAQRFSGQ